MNTTAYKNLTEEQKREADSRDTSYTLWAAILLAATDTRTADDIWQDQTQEEDRFILATLRYWIATGQISDEDPIYWGGLKMTPDSILGCRGFA